jgi:hypothetical protein
MNRITSKDLNPERTFAFILNILSIPVKKGFTFRQVAVIGTIYFRNSNVPLFPSGFILIRETKKFL